MTIQIYGFKLVITCLLYVGFAVSIDTIFGLIRVIKEHKWNSCVGINGAIRKISMMVCIGFTVIMDSVCGFNLIRFFPEAVVQKLEMIHIVSMGFADFFGILFIAYECVSILKNMYLCGLPVKWVWIRVYQFLNEYTDELPDTEDVKTE